MDRFAQILYDLGKELDVDLHPDQNRICQINYRKELEIQLQYEESKEQLLIATFVCDVPPGKYREKLLKAALKNNGVYPRMGILAFSEKNNKLTLFEYVPVEGITGEKLLKMIEAFTEKALLWKNAVEKGQSLPTISDTSKGGSMFGLKP